MIDYDVTKIQKLFDEHGISELEVLRVDTYGNCVNITATRKTYLNEYVKDHFFKKLVFKSSGKTYELLSCYVIEGGESRRIKTVYLLRDCDKIIDVIAFHEFENAENFANPHLTLNIEEIISEEN